MSQMPFGLLDFSGLLRPPMAVINHCLCLRRTTPNYTFGISHKRPPHKTKDPKPSLTRGSFSDGLPAVSAFQPFSASNFHRICKHAELFDLVEVHVAVDVGGLLVQHFHLVHVLLHRRDLAHQRAHRGQLGGTQIDPGVDAETVGEVTRRGRYRGAALLDLRLATAQKRNFSRTTLQNP